jgi:Raf kinase inhibitor-like YbhB/YbcL family protein
MLKKICLLFMLFTSSVFAMNQINVTSESIVEGKINKIHACSKFGGRDLPVQIRAENIPGTAKFLALVADDPDAIRPAGRVWVHWNIFNISTTGPTFSIEAGTNPKGELGRTSGNAKGYEGMCPPDGVHKYRFAVFALSERTETGGLFGPSAMTIDQFETKFKSLIVGKGYIEGKF